MPALSLLPKLEAPRCACGNIGMVRAVLGWLCRSCVWKADVLSCPFCDQITKHLTEQVDDLVLLTCQNRDCRKTYDWSDAGHPRDFWCDS